MNNLEIFKQSSIKIDKIYFDPYYIDNDYHDAKYIFITHSHYDHYSITDIMKVCNDETIYVGPTDVIDELKDSGIPSGNLAEVSPGKEYQLGDISFETTFAYNKAATFHLKDYNWVGYVIKYLNTRYYVCGDTDDIKENHDIKCDVMFVPIGGKYTMNPNEAAIFTNIIKPKVVVPIHYGFIVGSKNSGQEFSKIVDKDIEIKIISCY